MVKKMVKKMILSLILFAFLLNFVVPYTTTAPTWLSSPYFRAGNNKVINRNTGNSSTPTYTFTFSSALTGIPNLAYGVKNYRGIDQLKETNFEIRRTGLTASTFSVSIQLYGSGNLFLLAVPYIAIDPSFPHHLNSFDNVALQYGSTLTNITTPSSTVTAFTKQIDYSQQSSANTYKTFTTPLSGNKIVLFITSLCVYANSTAPFKLEISYEILNSTFYSWTAKVYQYSTVTKLHFSEIIYNEDDVMGSKLYTIVNYNWISDGLTNYKAFPIQLVDNMIVGLTDFGSANGSCGLEYNWYFDSNVGGIPYVVYFNTSTPSPNSTATGGLNYIKSTLFYIKTWKCNSPHVYFNITAELCQDACSQYYYFNSTAGTCTACHYSCYNCTQPNSKTSCSQCQSGLKRNLVGNTCVCANGYFDDGFQPACKACIDVDPNSLTCSYTIDSSKPTSFYQNIFNQTTWASDILPDFTPLTCKNSSFFVNSSNLCQLCPSYCLSCTDASTCTACNSSAPAKLYTDNLCYLCSLSNCEACYPDNVCKTCSTGYVVQSGVCVTCAQACTCDGWVLPKVNGACSTLCGDGIQVGSQQCDDGNTNDHDGCSSTCLIQDCNVSCQCDGWTSPWVAANNSCTSICGDGLVRGNQQCDDGNLIDGDGCNLNCRIQGCNTTCTCDGWTLPIIYGVCSTVCGDSLLRGDQQCDDGNTNDHDGCSSTCTLQPCNASCLCDGWASPWNAGNTSCTSICGDGLVRGNQQCDDGNILDHDGCSSICQLESCDVSCQCNGWVLPWASGSCSTLCGDGIKIGLEQCDDGNLIDHDGCSSTCTIQICNVSCLCDGWTQPWISSENSCTPLCGDGILRGNEQCDDGNLNDEDGCDSTCHVEDNVFLTAQMSKYPALALFALGFRIVGLQALNVYQSFQLITDSLKIQTFRISFNIHGYTDHQNFPLSIPTEQHILTNFNFMYFIVIGLFLIGAFLEVYYTICRKSNKILDINQQDIGIKDSVKSVTSEDPSDDNGEFTVHYNKSLKKQKTEVFVTSQLYQSQIIKEKEYESFWGSIIFRQIFYDLLVNLLSVFVYSLVDQIKAVSIGSFLHAQTLVVIISMVFLLAVILTVCAVEMHSFGENHLKFNKGQALEYWLLLIGEKIVFSAILGSKSFWNLEVILVLKFLLLTYYCCARMYFQHIQKVRSVITHFIHFMLIFAVLLNEHIFKRYGLFESFPKLFMQYIYCGLLSVVLLICLAFYVRLIMHRCEADFRNEENQNLSEISNGSLNAVFDVKNGDKMEQSAQQFSTLTKKQTNIFDDILTVKMQKSSKDLDKTVEPAFGAKARKMVSTKNLSSFNSPTTSSTNGSQNTSLLKKSMVYSHARSPYGSDMMSVVENQGQDRVTQLTPSSSDQDKKQQQKLSKSLYKPSQFKENKVKFNQEKIIHSDIQNQSKNQPQQNIEQNMKRSVRRVALRTKTKDRQIEKKMSYKTEGSEQMDDIDEQIKNIFENKKVFNETKKQQRQLSLHSKKKHLTITQSNPRSLGEKVYRTGIQSDHVQANKKDQTDDLDKYSINFE